MSSIEEKRVFADRADKTSVYLASEIGVVRVSVSDDRIGSFGIERRCTARDLAFCPELAVATDEDVLLDGEPTGFGPAVVVGGSNGPIAVSPEGRVARYEHTNRGWADIGCVEGVRAADGDLLATEEGIYRVGDELTHVGLEGVTDVSTRGIPLASTDTGLYRLGNGWMRDLDGGFDRVAGSGSAGTLERACAVGEGFYSYDGEWREHDAPEAFTAVAIGESVYGVSAGGTLSVDAGEGWRSQSLGVSGVRAMLID